MTKPDSPKRRPQGSTTTWRPEDRETSKVAPAIDTGPLEEMLQHKGLKMLMRKGKITEEVVNLIQNRSASLVTFSINHRSAGQKTS